MKKIPTLFLREFLDDHTCKTLQDVTPGMECVMRGETIPTVKYDGAACAVINGKFYKRYDAKQGKKVPEGAIPCIKESDPITKHFPHWIEIKDDPSDKWFKKAYEYSFIKYSKNPDIMPDNTYEAIGKHFNGNPYGLDHDELIRHGEDVITSLLYQPLEYYQIKDYLRDHPEHEGIVFWKADMSEPLCKIRRKDFGFKW